MNDAGQLDEPARCRCGNAIEDLPYLSTTCHDCYAAAWDGGFSGTREWAEHLFGDEDEEPPAEAP